MARLNLPTSEYAAVYLEMVRVLRNDPILSGCVRTLLSWEGKPTDAQTLTVGMAPAIRITPTGGPEEWHCPQSMKGPLYLNLEILVQGYDATDLMNLWRAVAAAFYDPQATTFVDIQARLRDAGAYPPSPMFTAPAFDAKPESDYLFSLSQIRIMVQTQLGSRGTNT